MRNMNTSKVLKWFLKSAIIRLIIKSTCSIFLIYSPSILAKDYQTQLHISLGMVSATYSGPVSGDLSLPMALNFEYELIKSPSHSYTFDNTIAIDSADSKTKYFATHFGGRYYFLSSNLNFHENDHGNTISIIPKWRYYYGWNVGVAQVVVRSLGTVLDAISTVLEYGGHIGTIYQVGKSWGIEGKFSYLMGNGFSSVSVNSTVMQLYVGGAYYF